MSNEDYTDSKDYPLSAKANPVDVYVGNRLRSRRILLGISQKKVAEKLGITFQQVQKYECGSNRISASRLWDISQILKIPVEYFFSGMEGEIQNQSPMMQAKPQDEIFVSDIFKIEDPMLNQETIRLVTAFTKIKNKRVSAMLRALMVELAKSSR